MTPASNVPAGRSAPVKGCCLEHYIQDFQHVLFALILMSDNDSQRNRIRKAVAQKSEDLGSSPVQTFLTCVTMNRSQFSSMCSGNNNQGEGL